MFLTRAMFATSLLLSATAAYPQVATNQPRSQGDLISFAFNQPYTSQNRVELARLFDAYCREIFDSVPTNTPAEDA